MAKQTAPSKPSDYKPVVPDESFAAHNAGGGGNIRRVKVAKGRYALRCKTTRQFYVNGHSSVAGGTERTLDPNRAKIFTGDYLANQAIWEWHYFYELVPDAELAKLKKLYSPKETPQLVAQKANAPKSEGYECCYCEHLNKFTPFVITNWEKNIESKCAACGKKNFLTRGIARKKL